MHVACPQDLVAEATSRHAGLERVHENIDLLAYRCGASREIGSANLPTWRSS